jgi:Zc3h12a-like Ribonuclease NYN domain
MSATPGLHLVVDGSNIATEGRSVPSLMQLDEAVRAFLEEYPHEHWTVVVDATFEHRIDSSEQRAYDEALAANELLTPPAGTIGRGDRFILQIANRVDATVFSNDSFQEFHADYPWLFEEGRLIGGKPVPGIGWVFAPRSPVRGAKSRMVTRAAKKGTKKSAPAPSSPEQPPTPAKRSRKRTAAGTTAAAAGPPPVPTTPPPGRRRATPPPPAAPGPPPSGAGRRRRGPSAAAAEPVNEGLAFVEFISEHPIGSTVEGEVVSFTSHGAQVLVGDVRCYVPLRGLGDPAPRAAREVLSRGEVRTFVVQALDAPRRGIDLALPGFEQLEAPPPDLVPPAAPEEPPAPRPRRRTRARPVPADEPVGGRGADPAPLAADQASADVEATLPESEATLPPKKTTTKKRAAPAKKKATAAKRSTTATRKSPAKKTTAKKATTARKTTARKAPAKRTASKASKTTKKATGTARKAATGAKRTVRKATTAAKKTTRKATKATKKSR